MKPESWRTAQRPATLHLASIIALALPCRWRTFGASGFNSVECSGSRLAKTYGIISPYAERLKTARKQQPPPSPYLTIQPTAGWQAINLRELWQFRDLLTTLAQRDVKLRYRQTALGALWVLSSPSWRRASSRSSSARSPSSRVRRPALLRLLLRGAAGLERLQLDADQDERLPDPNANLVSKVYFPRLVLPLSTVFSTLIDFAVALVA